MSWPLTEDGQYYEFEGDILIPVDPSSGVAQLILRPQGGIGVGVPAIESGDDGVPPELSTITVTELAYDDPTPASAAWTLSDPGPPPVYTLALSLHSGQPGADGDTVLDVTDFGTPLPYQILVVNEAADDLIYATQKVGDRYVPASIANTPSGNASYTLCAVSVPAQDFAWRPHVSGQCIVTGTGADVVVDVVARLNSATSGNIVGTAFGVAGQNPPPHVLSAGPPPASNDSYDKVAANATATIYLRAERRSGTDTFTTNNSTTSFCVRVCPVPDVVAGS